MQLVFNQSTVWLFATPNELLEIATVAQQKVTEARLGESLVVLEEGINQSDFVFRISANKDSGTEPK
ncbi:MAG: hypothetical protein RBJ76_13505 [Stenomitos frigidus ULC029]